MGAGNSIQLVRVFGIRIGVDVSWFLVLFFFIFVLSSWYTDALDRSEGVAYATAVASALLFFVSLVLHELGHALTARRLGIGIKGIDLWFFGGIAKMERDADSPGADFKVAIAGPLVTAAIVGVCVGAGLLAAGGGERFWEAVMIEQGAALSPGLVLLGWLASINTLLFFFNMVPAYPLDGGRIARAIAWKMTGERNKATRFAAVLGQLFAYLLIGLGLAQLLIGGALFGGLWLILLGWILSQAARSAIAQSVFADRLGGVTVADIMDTEPVAIPGELPVERAHEEFFLRYRWSWFPAVDATGRFLGIVREERVAEAERAGEGARPVGELIDPAAQREWRVAADAEVESLLGSPQLREAGALMAVDAHGVLRGVVTREQVQRVLSGALAPRLG